jgi:hypothetical protein
MAPVPQDLLKIIQKPITPLKYLLTSTYEENTLAPLAYLAARYLILVCRFVTRQ